MKNIYRLIAFMVFCAAIKYLNIHITDGTCAIIIATVAMSIVCLIIFDDE